MSETTALLDHAAAVLHVSMQTARRMARLGMIPGCFRAPGTQQWLIHIPTFSAWITDQATSTSPAAPTLREAAQARVPSPSLIGETRSPAYAALLARKVRTPRQ